MIATGKEDFCLNPEMGCRYFGRTDQDELPFLRTIIRSYTGDNRTAPQDEQKSMHLETRQAGLCAKLCYLLQLRSYFSCLGHPWILFSKQCSLCHLGVRGTNENNRRYSEEQTSLIILNLKHCLQLKGQGENFSDQPKNTGHSEGLLKSSFPFSLEC